MSPQGIEVALQSENRIARRRSSSGPGREDPDLISAGNETVTGIPGSSFLSSAASFAMIRGGHIDLSVFGAMEVDRDGNLANRMIPGKVVKAWVAQRIRSRGPVAMEHTTRAGAPKILIDARDSSPENVW